MATIPFTALPQLKIPASNATLSQKQSRYHCFNASTVVLKNPISSKTERIRVSVNGSAPLEDDPVGIISGEWPESTALPNFDDLRAYLETNIISKKIKPNTPLREVMSTQLKTATVDETLEEIQRYFDTVSGLPVVNVEMQCVGVISKRDIAEAPNGLKSTVGEVMSSPPITLSPENSVMDATVLMLKQKIHRIPVVNEKQQAIGIVTRSDIFQALETMAI